MEGRAQLFHLYLGTDFRGFKVYSYAAGTTTVKDVWADPGKTTPLVGYDGDGNPTPVVADNNGWIAFFADGEYRFDITDANDILIRTLDPYRVTQAQPFVWEGSHGTTLPAAQDINQHQVFLKHNAQGGFQGLYHQAGSSFNQIAGSVTGGTYHVSSYGAAGDGVTDDAGAFIDAIAAAQAAGGGTVLMDAKTYGTTQVIDLPDHVGLVGCGDETVIKALGSLLKVVIIDETRPRGNRGGLVSNFRIAGNSLAEIGLYVGLSVQRHFEAVTVGGCIDCGVDIVSAQNNTFIGLDVDRNGSSLGAYSCGIRMNRGAGNNLFLRCEVELNEPYQLVLHDDGGGTDGYPQGPTANTFIRCVFERATANGIAQVYIRSGILNEFLDCTYSGSNVAHTMTVVKVTQQDWTANGARTFAMDNRFIGGHSSGSAGYTTFLTVEGSASQVRHVHVDRIYLEAHDVAFSCDANARIYLGPWVTYYAVTSLFDGAGAEETVLSMFLGRSRAFIARDSASGACYQAGVYGETDVRWRLLAGGTMGWGDGTATPDLRLSRYELPISEAVALLCSGPVAISDTNATLSAGSVAPEGNEPAYPGSLYMRTNGSIYRKASGDGTDTGWTIMS